MTDAKPERCPKCDSLWVDHESPPYEDCAELKAPKPERCPTCDSGDRNEVHHPTYISRYRFGACDPWHDARVANEQAARRLAQEHGIGDQARIQELEDALAEKERMLTDQEQYLGLCPHGNLKCFYCWRDAGFPGGLER